MMTKSEAIAAITRRNPTVTGTFLEEFSTGDLQAYLDRLVSARDTPWELGVEAVELAPEPA
jgi:hypothetical protein